MTVLLYPCMVLSAIGLVWSIASHVAALCGLPIPGGDLVWGLHIGIFLVWLPTVMVAQRMTRHGKKANFWKPVFSGYPSVVRVLIFGLFAYAIVNFFQGVGTNIEHGKQGDKPDVNDEVRLFSGHWMVFYSVALATLYSAIKRPDILRARQCASGHEVGPLDNFCPMCGAPLTAPDTTPRPPKTREYDY